MASPDVDLSSARAFTKQAGSTFGLQLMAAVTGGVTVIVSARALGPSDQGVAYSLVALGAVPPAFLGSGLVGAIVRLWSPDSRRGSVRGVVLAVAVMCALSLATVLLLLRAGQRVDDGGSTGSVAAVLLLSLLVPVDLALSGLLRSTGRVSTVAAIDLVESVLVLVAVGAFILHGDLEPLEVVVSFLVGLTVSIAVTALVAGRLRASEEVTGERLVSTIELLRVAAPLSLGAGVTLAVFRFDVVWVRVLLGEAAAGVYSVAARVAEPALLLPGAVSAVVMSRSSRGSHEELRRTTPTIFWSALVSSIVPIGGLAIAASLLLEPMFGGEYKAAVPLVLALGASRALLGSGLILSEDMNQRGHQWMPVLVSGGLVLAALGATLVVEDGTLGLAASAVAGLGAVFVCLSLVAYRRTADLAWSTLLAAGSPARLLAQGRKLWA